MCMARKACLEYIQRQLLKVPGVYAVGLGDANSREVVVSVEYKHEQLDDVIAQLGLDNVRIRYGSKPKPTVCGCYYDTCRPVEAGVSVSDCSEFFATCGSAGPFIDPTTKYVYLLTNAHCLTPESEVVTNFGITKLSEYIKRPKPVLQLGNFEMPIAITSREYEGPVYSLQIYGWPFTLELTSEHQLAVVTLRKSDKVEKLELKMPLRLYHELSGLDKEIIDLYLSFYAKGCYRDGKFSEDRCISRVAKELNTDREYVTKIVDESIGTSIVKWIPAKHLHELIENRGRRDKVYLIVPKLQHVARIKSLNINESVDVYTCPICGKSFSTSYTQQGEGGSVVIYPYCKAKIEDKTAKRIHIGEVPLDYELGWFFGVLTVDGMIRFNHNNPELRITSANVSVINRVRDIIRRKFGIEAHIEETKTKDGRKWYNVIIHHPKHFLQRLYEEIYVHECATKGKKSSCKKLPEWVIYAPKEFITGLLDGLLESDGYIWKNGGKRIATTSKTLAVQLYMLGFFVGKYVTISVVSPKNEKRNKIYVVYLSKGDDNGAFNIIDTENYFLVKLKGVGVRHYRGVVYNFETRSETYAVPVLVHNCTRYIKTCDPNSVVGANVAQPGGSCSDNYYIGTIAKVTPITNGGKLDTALIAPKSLDIVSNKVHKLEEILGHEVYFNGQIATPSAGTKVYKSGPTTGAQQCSVVATHVSASIDYSVISGSCIGTVTITNVIQTTKCTDRGDSGSLAVLDDGTFVGQTFGNSDTDSFFIAGESISSELGIVPYTSGGTLPPTPGARQVQCTLI